MRSYKLFVIVYETFGKIPSFSSILPINFMQQYDMHSCGLFVIAYAIDIIFNIQLKSLKYVTTQMKTQILNFMYQIILCAGLITRKVY